MDKFREFLLLDEADFKEELSKIDSYDLINYLRNCNDKSIKKEYYKRTKNILGKNFVKLLKLAINYKKNKLNLFDEKN